ncbi:MAG: DUF3179 domain-containing protein [Halobacteriaceae archaeon]
MNVKQVIPKDTIPSVDSPEFRDTYGGEDSDRLIVVDKRTVSNIADSTDNLCPRGYPIRYLNYHEIVNDTYGGIPIAVTWCPLCSSAIIYDRRVGGKRLEFGVSGKLADDDLVMYDRNTDSEWKQSRGICIRGHFEGQELRVLPVSMMTYEEFREAYSDGQVLASPGGQSEAAGEGSTPEPIDYDKSPYDQYFSGEGFGLQALHNEGTRNWDRDDIDPKTLIYGIEDPEEPVGFPYPEVQKHNGVLQTSVGGKQIVIFATENGMSGYQNPGYSFTRIKDKMVQADGTQWNMNTGQSNDGRSLTPINGKVMFAFAWQDDHGTDAFYLNED